MYPHYGDRAAFLGVYVRESHPSDGAWHKIGKRTPAISIPQPRQEAERVAVSQDFCRTLDVALPFVVDDMDDRVGHLYSGLGNRLYLLNQEGRVVYKSGRGPYGFMPGEMEQSLLLLLWDETSQSGGHPPLG